MQDHPRKIRIAVSQLIMILVCVCVFLFGLHVKLAQYQAPSPNVTLTTSSKLWVTDHHMDAGDTFSLAVLPFLSAIFLMCRVSPLLPRWQPFAEAALPSEQILLGSNLFFRPPPALR